MLGLSGGIGPVRASISNRGVGGSVGPVNFGTGWSGGGSGGALGVILFAPLLGLALGLILVAVGWPLLLAMRWIGGPIGIALGVVLEVGYLFALLTFYELHEESRERQRDLRYEAKRQERINRTREELIARTERILESAPTARAAMEANLAQLQDRPTGFHWTEVEGIPADYPREERFIGAGKGWLSAGRVAQRGGARVQTDIEHGTWIVTDKCVRFRGATRTDRWPLSAVEGVLVEPGRVLLPLKTRSSITGISAGHPEDDMIEFRIALTWARDLPGTPTTAIALVEHELAQFDASMDALREELRLAESTCETSAGD